MRRPGDRRRAGQRSWPGVQLALVLCAVLVAGMPAQAQQQGGTPLPVLTLDQERLYETTLFGQRMQRELNAARNDLIAENSRLQSELEAEEARLTEQRGEMEVEAFRELADAFDERVTEIRAEQEAKTRALQRRQERAQQSFFQAIAPVVQEVVREKGALAILDARAIILASDEIDVTDEVRAKVDQLLGDGGDLATPPPEPVEEEPEAPIDDTPPLGVPIGEESGVPPAPAEDQE